MKLTKSQRVIIIQDIAGRLAGDDWTMIDLILKQFSLPTSDQWASDRSSYIIEMIGNAADKDLVELAEHFGMETGIKPASQDTPPETPYWEEGKLKVFVSHLTSHREQAAAIQKSLALLGMSGFVAHNDIHPTLEWQIEIETALSTCDLLIALIHPEFINSQWCDQEVGYALGRGIPVFTVRCGADPYGFVSRFQAFNGNGKQPAQIAQEMFDAALDHKKLQTKMADIMVGLFIDSGSFAVAKSRIAYLERLKVWEPSYSDRLKKAVVANSQINGSWGVPAQLRNVIAKWETPA